MEVVGNLEVFVEGFYLFDSYAGGWGSFLGGLGILFVALEEYRVDVGGSWGFEVSSTSA